MHDPAKAGSCILGGRLLRLGRQHHDRFFILGEKILRFVK